MFANLAAVRFEAERRPDFPILVLGPNQERNSSNELPAVFPLILSLGTWSHEHNRGSFLSISGKQAALKSAHTFGLLRSYTFVVIAQ